MHKKISASELDSLCKSNNSVTIIDVRTPMEYQAEHVESSINVPLSDIASKASAATFNRSNEIFLMCRSGKRAEMAASQLNAAGIRSTVVTGGMLAWRTAGLPVLSGKQCLPIENQVQVLVGAVLMASSLLALRGSVTFLGITTVCGIGLLYTGLTGNCILAKALMKAPWNQSSTSNTHQSTEEPKNTSCCG